jgi:hypothetical protein
VSLLNFGDGSSRWSGTMDNERAGRRVLHEDEAIRRGQLLEFITQQEQRGLSKGNMASTQAETARSHTKVRTMPPTSSSGLRKS